MFFDYSFDFKYIATEFTSICQAPQRSLEVENLKQAAADAKKIIVRDKGLVHHKYKNFQRWEGVAGFSI